MTNEKAFVARSHSKCELCGESENLAALAVAPRSEDNPDDCVFACGICRDQIGGTTDLDVNHWRCLNDSMWSQTLAVQVMAWRMLNRLSAEDWAQNLLEMLYLDDESLAWAQAAGDRQTDESDVRHLDANGALLEAGDTVTLIKDLNVKGANFTAKRGTAVRGISLVADNPEQIEGRVSGQQIVILTKFVKRSA